VPVLSIRRWALIVGLILIGAAAMGWYYNYQSKCHGMDDCAARSAESHERDTPAEQR
jgi:hypothetical protein